MGKYLNKEQIFDAEDGEDMYANEEQLVARLDFFEKQLMDQTADTVVEDKINTLLEIARIQVERYKGADAWERAMTAFDLAKENELWELATEACDAMFLSETLLYPVKAITRRLARMNENFLEQIDTENLPDEFVPLGESVNKLIDRIQNFVKYQKELFIGTAHELKTPLAVMKTKNEVTLIKDRDSQKYQDTLRVNNKTIDEMNKMISSILEVGRQEGAQFEKPIEIDLVQFLKDKAKDFSLIAKGGGKNVEVDIEPEKYCIISQPTLLTHMLQNFVQNAIKFSPDGASVKIKSRLEGDDFRIEVIDDGEGIDENADLFAPFKREGNKGGAGLGLFLAKGAADAVGATISLKNRKDAKGAVATIVLNSKNYCPIDDDLEDGKISIFSPFKRKS